MVKSQWHPQWKRAASVFVAQATMVFLLGTQTINIIERSYLGAASTSLLLGILGYFLTAAIAEARLAGMGSLVWLAFITAGPVGICLAIRAG